MQRHKSFTRPSIAAAVNSDIAAAGAFVAALHNSERPGTQAPLVAELLVTAANLSEELRARVKPIAEASWALDSKSAMIRRHANGASLTPNGSPADYAELTEAVAAARKLLAMGDGGTRFVEASEGDVKGSRELAGDAVTILIIDQASKLLKRWDDIMQDMLAPIHRGDGTEATTLDPAKLFQLQSDVDKFAGRCLVTRRLLGGAQTVRDAMERSGVHYNG